VPAPPDREVTRRRARRRSASAFLFFFATALVAPVIPSYVVDTFGAGGVGVGIAVAAMGVPGLLSRPLAGRFVDRRGPPSAIAVGGALGVVAFLGQALAPVLVVFALFRTLIGLADGFVLVGAARGSDDGRRGRGSAYTRFAALFVAGTAVGPLVAIVITRAWSTQAVFFVAAACAAVGTVVLGETVPRRAKSPTPAAQRESHGGFLFRPVVAAGIALGLANLGFGAIYGFGVLRGAELGMGSPEWLLSAFSVTLIAGRVMGNRWPDRIGLGRSITIATVISAVGLFGAGLSTSVVGLTVALVTVGVGYAFIMPAVLAEAASVAGDSRSGAAVGTVMGLLDLVLTVGTVGLGVVAARWGASATFVASGLVALAALPLLWWWRVRIQPGAGESPPTLTPRPRSRERDR